MQYLIFISIILASFSATATTQTLDLCMDNKVVFPWSIPESEDGLDIILLKMVDKNIPEVNFRYVSMPWNDCFLALKQNKVDGVFQASYKKIRERFGAYPKNNGNIDQQRALHLDSYSLFVNKHSNITYDGKKIKGLGKRHIVTTKGYSIESDLKSLNYQVYGHSEPTIKQFELLIDGTFAAAATLTHDGELLLRNPKFENKLKKLEPGLVEKYYYLMLSNKLLKHQKPLTEKIWNEIHNVKSSEAYRRSIEEWLIDKLSNS